MTEPVQFTKVTPDNFTRAETDTYFADIVRNQVGLARFNHYREPMPIDHQTVVRANRDTLYSSAVFDLDAGPVTITLPDAGDRFRSLMVLDEDEYIPLVAYEKGAYTLAREQIGTRYVLTGIRTFVDPEDPNDIAEVHRLQDATALSQASTGAFDVPNWDPASQKAVRDALVALSATLPNMNGAFGKRGQVDPVRHLIASASAWGGNPDTEAQYLNVIPADNDGRTAYSITVKDVPVDGFWSISVYNAKGYYEKNARDAYSLNNITARKNTDGSVTVRFGGCDADPANCLPICDGWNYMVRLYRPRPEILNGTWEFPTAQPV